MSYPLGRGNRYMFAFDIDLLHIFLQHFDYRITSSRITLMFEDYKVFNDEINIAIGYFLVAILTIVIFYNAEAIVIAKVSADAAIYI